MWWPAVESVGDKAARVEAGLAQLRGCSSVSKAAVLLRDVLEEYCTAHAYLRVRLGGSAWEEDGCLSNLEADFEQQVSKLQMYGVSCASFHIPCSGSGFHVPDFRFWTSDSGYQVTGFRFRVWNKVSGSGF